MGSHEPPTVKLALQSSVEKLTARSAKGSFPTLPSEKYPSSRDDPGTVEANDADTSNTVLLRVGGLVRKLLPSKGRSRTFSTVLPLPVDTPVENLRARILEAEPDAVPDFETLRFSNARHEINSNWVDVETAAAKVTSGNPCYNPIQGYKINRGQTIASFFSRAFPSPVQIQLRKHMAAKDSVYTPSYTITFGQREMMDGQISLLRSAKVPKDGKEYKIPAGLGTLPIYDVRSFCGSLPVPMVAKGGVLVTMHDVEAMCFAFDSVPKRKYAARLYLGDINGISGVSLFDNSKSGSAMSKQDYVVIPDQAQLHGVTVRPGLVRQFVTTPVASQAAGDTLTTEDSRRGQERMPGTEDSRILGAKMEGQMTGKDSISGIQLQIIPQLNTNTMFAGNVENVIEGSPLQDSGQPADLAIRYDVLKTPEELGLEEGSFVHLKDLSERLHSRKKVLNDLFAEVSPRLESTDVLDLHTDELYDYQITVNVRMEESTETKGFDFHRSDTIDGIATFLQQEYRAPGRVLYVKLALPNIPDLLVPITTWQDFTMLALVHSGKPRFARASDQRAAILELDFILATPKDDCPPRRFFRLASYKRFYLTPYFTRMFPIAAAGKISDICRQIEAIEGSSVRLFQRKSGGTGVEMRGPQPVFDTTGDSIEHEVPVFEILQSHQAEFEIQIRTMGTTLSIWVKSSHTIRNLKRRIQEKEVPLLSRKGSGEDDLLGGEWKQSHDQQLTFAGYELREEFTLGDYNIGPGVILDIPEVRSDAAQCRGYPRRLRLYIKGLGHEVIVYLFGRKVSAAFAKQRFSKKSGIEPRRLVLTHKAVELQNNEALSGYCEQMLHVSLRPDEPKVLGVGVGGNIVQDITPDDSDPRLWDMANSKIVSIQILNTATFRSLTGLEPPPTPIRAERGGTVAGAEVQSGQGRDGIGAEGTFDGLQGVDAWRSPPILGEDGIAMLTEQEESADGSSTDGSSTDGSSTDGLPQMGLPQMGLLQMVNC